ncbi:MAG: dienelactone hydrolase family protein [Bacteroidales bacterium]|nr:dienelactone hydrolase family protein [Candidatus Equimonas faecalis]
MILSKGRLAAMLALLLVVCQGAGAWSIKAHRNASATGGYNFMLYTPDVAGKDTARVPLIVFLHGASLQGSDLKRVERYGPLDAVHKGLDIPAYVLAPQCRGGWNAQKVMNTVQWVKSQHRIDSTRVYVIGMSMGGYGTLDFASAYASQVAAAIGICGGVNAPIDPLATLPLWILHGTADRPVPISCSERVVQRIRQINKGERLIFTRLPGIDHGQPARLFYRHEMYEWLLEHNLNQEGRPVCRRYTLDNRSIRNAYRNLPGHGRTVR